MSFQNKYLVLGDNREVSKDSRAFGLIDEDQIVGKVSIDIFSDAFSEFNIISILKNTKFNMKQIQHRLSVLI